MAGPLGMFSTASPSSFALAGAAGYVAPRHLAAIRAVGGQLRCASDPHDSVGILERYFPEAEYVRGTEGLRRWFESQGGTDYLSICSPNHLHFELTQLALRSGSSVICEKPLVLEERELAWLLEQEASEAAHIFPVLQLREHPELLVLRQQLATSPSAFHEVDLRYITARGPWYHASWKGDEQRSGGVVFAIGIHFIDLLLWLFGPVMESRVYLRDDRRVAGELHLLRARVRWFLSVEAADLPSQTQGRRTHRSIRVDGSEIEFSGRFDDLHERVYRRVLSGEGIRVTDAAPSVRLAHQIRHATASQFIPPWLQRRAS